MKFQHKMCECPLFVMDGTEVNKSFFVFFDGIVCLLLCYINFSTETLLSPSRVLSSQIPCYCFYSSAVLLLKVAANPAEEHWRLEYVFDFPTSDFGEDWVDILEIVVQMPHAYSYNINSNRIPKHCAEDEHDPRQIRRSEVKKQQEGHPHFRIPTTPNVDHHER